MAVSGEKGKKGWIDWRVFWTVLILVIVAIPLWAFVAQRLITPGSGHETLKVSTTSTPSSKSSGSPTTPQTVSTTSTLP